MRGFFARSNRPPCLKILTFTTLFPNARNPSHGIFVSTRLRRLLQYAPHIEARVLAPVPWYPRRLPGPQRYTTLARVAALEDQDGLQVSHPRYPVVPRIGMRVTPSLLARSALRAARRLRREFDFDLIDAHYFYPDGVAAAQCARALGVPFTITARGTDINLIPRYGFARRQILAVADQASRVLTVCAALRDELISLGAAADNIVVARNGVDLESFTPAADRDAVRNELGMQGLCLCSVGHLIERKGHHLCIEALRDLPGASLYIIGDGPESGSLRRLASDTGVDRRVHYLGRIEQRHLPRYYSACDALLLASDREGWANVLLESMACGTPVVATAIWGTPEVVAQPEAGELVERRTAAALADGVKRLAARGVDRNRTRAYAETFSWDDTSELQARVFAEILGN